MTTATKKEKKRKEKKKLTLGRMALVAGTKQTFKQSILRLSISMIQPISHLLCLHLLFRHSLEHIHKMFLNAF
jgi:hypothetical protein